MTTGEAKEKKMVAARPQQFKAPESPEETGHLIGSRCKKCGDCFYPAKVVCNACGSQEMEEVVLSNKGIIYSYTIVYHTYPMMLLSGKIPFISAQIMIMPEKATTLQWLRYCDIDKVKVGMEVELCPFTFSEDAEKVLLAPAFRPVDRTLWSGKGGE